MRHTHTRVATGIAAVAAASLLLAGCSSAASPESSESSGALKVGAFLPLTGSIAYVAPGPQAAIYQAITDINEAGGVLGQPVELVIEANEGDSTDTSIAYQGVADLAASPAQFVIGPMGSTTSLNTVDRLKDAEIVSISPSATNPAITGSSPYYFRTVVSDEVQAEVVAGLIVQDGHQRVGVLAQNDDYGVGLRDKFERAFTEQGGEIVYGAKGSGQEFPLDQTMYSSEVAAVIGGNADAVVVFAYDQTAQIIPELANQGFDLSKLYLVDVNTSDYSSAFDAGLMTGTKGLVPGAAPDADFLDRLASGYQEVAGKPLSSTVYMLEAYDAMILGALAAERGGASDATTIRDNLAAVSGADGGEACDSFTSCKELLDSGSDIAYQGRAGEGPFNEQNDPSSATFGVYQYGADNKPVFGFSVTS